MNNLKAEVIIKIPFFDVDSLNLVWHGNYAKYFEIARCALMDKIGYNYNQMRDYGHYWPIVHLHTKYIKPLLFDQEVKIAATLNEYENCLKIKYLITDLKTGEKLTKGETMQMAIDIKTHETCFSSPEILIKKVKELL